MGTTYLLIKLGCCVALGVGVACRGEELDFTLPDGGSPSSTREQDLRDGAKPDGEEDDSATVSEMGGLEMSDSGSADAMVSDSFAGTAAEDGSAPNGGGSAGVGAGGEGVGGGAGNQGGDSDLIVYDPAGRPAGPGDAASWCERGEVEVELCGNDVDEDCDGRVDEMALLGHECEAGCRVAELQCNVDTHELICRGLHGCSVEQVVECGDGVVGIGETCDPQAPTEDLGSCTWRCTRPLFTRCLFGIGNSDPSVCEGNTECSWFTGACMPLVGIEGLRCPEYQVVGSDDETEIYPMLETEEDQCWVSCSRDEQCPPSLRECYQGYCVVEL